MPCRIQLKLKAEMERHMKPRKFAGNRVAAVLMAAALVIGVWGGNIISPVFAQTNQNAQTKSHSSTKSSHVNVNTADLQTLETLPGITPTLAKRIVAGRPYKTINDLSQVKGLTQTKIDGIKSDVTFGSASTSTKKAASAKQGSSTASTGNGTSTTASRKASGESSTGLSPTGNSSSKTSALASGEKININEASLEQLEALPGIGPSKAQAIIDYRQQNGRFESPEDIEKVSGIKGGTFSKIKDSIKVGD